MRSEIKEMFRIWFRPTVKLSSGKHFYIFYDSIYITCTKILVLDPLIG